MKLIIDIPDNEYNQICELRLHDRTFYDDAIRKGIPLDKIRDEIESEMNNLYRQKSIDQRTLTIIHACQRHIAIIDKYREEQE